MVKNKAEHCAWLLKIIIIMILRFLSYRTVMLIFCCELSGAIFIKEMFI